MLQDKVAKQRLIIVSAPSGSGKSSFCNKALGQFPILIHSISHTTRHPRKGEAYGHPYFFITEEKFLQMIHKELFAEWAVVHSYYYGTSKQQLKDAWEQGRIVIMDIDVQGAKILKKQYSFAHTIFILPPSMEELEKRLRKRDGNTKFLELRLKNAKEEIKMAHLYDHQVINNEFDHSYQLFHNIIENIINKSSLV